MYIQRARQANPYSAYQTMVEQRAMLGERGLALRDPEARLSELAAPAIRHQMLAHARRYERLGGMASGFLQGLSDLARPDQAPVMRMVATVRATMAGTSGAAPAADGATAARLEGNLPISLTSGSPATTATLTSLAPRVRQGTGTPATAATLTLGPVALNTSQMKSAVLQGDNLFIARKAKEADLGELTINGVTTRLGVFAGNDERAAAQFVADRINANQDNTVTASVDTNSKRVTLTSKVPGTAGGITIDRVVADTDGKQGNDVSAGFQVGDRAAGTDAGSTDFGSVTINGVTTTFGVRSNLQQTPQSATQWLVDRLNANTDNDFTASVGGEARNQIVLTSKLLGTQSQLSIDQVRTDSDGNAANAGATGFVAGLTAAGQEAVPGVTDLGAVTINGVTTTFGAMSNLGLTQQTAARYMVDRLNANTDLAVVASLGGTNQDQVVLTAKAPGSAGSFQIDRVEADSDGDAGNDGFNGWVAGERAAGQDGVSGSTDFGSITINGITTEFGVLDGRTHTSQSALQFLLERLNQSNPTLTAREQDGKILLTSRGTGSQSQLSIDAVTSGSDDDPTNNRGLGFAVGQTAVGKNGAQAPDQVVDAKGTRLETTYERMVDSAQATQVLGKTTRVIQDLNQYLKTLKEEGPDLPRSVRSYGADLWRSLRQEAETFNRLGIRLEEDGLEIDEPALEQALRASPPEAPGLFQRLQQALEAKMGSQAFALDQMRAVAKSTSESASTIGHVAASIYKMQHRAQKLSWMLEEMAPVEKSQKEQGDRLKKLGEDQEDPREKQEEKAKAPLGAEPENQPFGLRRSPVPDSFYRWDDASRGLGPRWPVER